MAKPTIAKPDSEKKFVKNTDSAGFPKPPPHLRMSDNENQECDNCKFFNTGKCDKYSGLPVVKEWVCDSWKSWY